MYHASAAMCPDATSASNLAFAFLLADKKDELLPAATPSLSFFIGASGNTSLSSAATAWTPPDFFAAIKSGAISEGMDRSI